MKEFNPTSIVLLQNTLSQKNIERLVKEFITEKLTPDNYPDRIDEQKGILFFYDSYKNDFTKVKFETRLKEILWEITNNIKNEIDLSNTYLTNNERVKFWVNILKSFDYINKNSTEVLSLFPICNKPFEEIENYLKSKYQFINISLFENSYFTLKPKYTQKDIQDIYNYITSELYLDDESFNIQDFNSSLFDYDSDVKLIFNCSTEIMVTILNELSILFTDFSRKKIEKSGRFITKNNTPIKVDNFNTTISRLRNGKYKKSNKDIYKITEFFSRYSNK
jgi:hypothetical protein